MPAYRAKCLIKHPAGDVKPLGKYLKWGDIFEACSLYRDIVAREGVSVDVKGALDSREELLKYLET